MLFIVFVYFGGVFMILSLCILFVLLFVFVCVDQLFVCIGLLLFVGMVFMFVVVVMFVVVGGGWVVQVNQVGCWIVIVLFVVFGLMLLMLCFVEYLMCLLVVVGNWFIGFV